MITSSLAHPHVRDFVGLRRIMNAVTVDAASTETSVSMCPASTSNASDPVTAAPITSATKMVPVNTKVVSRR